MLTKLFIKIAKVLGLKRGDYYKKKRWSDMARRVRDGRYNANKKRSMTDVATDNMLKDMYGPTYASLTKDKDAYAKCRTNVKALIKILRGYNIYYSWYSGEIWLVRSMYSMPAGKFIVYSRGYERPNQYAARAIMEWTGMTKDEIAEVYKKLVYFFRDELDKEFNGLDSIFSIKTDNIKLTVGAIVRDDL